MAKTANIAIRTESETKQKLEQKAKDNKKIAMLFYDNKNCSVGVPQLELEEIQLKNIR